MCKYYHFGTELLTFRTVYNVIWYGFWDGLFKLILSRGALWHVNLLLSFFLFLWVGLEPDLHHEQWWKASVYKYSSSVCRKRLFTATRWPDRQGCRQLFMWLELLSLTMPHLLYIPPLSLALRVCNSLNNYDYHFIFLKVFQFYKFFSVNISGKTPVIRAENPRIYAKPTLSKHPPHAEVSK